MKKPGLLLGEHIRAGKELKQAENIITRWSIKFGNSYPRNNFAFKQLCKSAKYLGLARSGAESNLFVDCPSDATTKIYYLGTELDDTIGLVSGLWAVEHSQYSEDKKMYPFHLAPIEHTCKRNLVDCFHNHRRENKWQLIFVGTLDDCSRVIDGLLDKKGIT